jgi:hypothetical protein
MSNLIHGYKLSRHALARSRSRNTTRERIGHVIKNGVKVLKGNTVEFHTKKASVFAKNGIIVTVYGEEIKREE